MFQNGQSRNYSSIPVKSNEYFSPAKCQPRLCGPKSLLKNGPERYLPEVKRLGCDLNHSLTSNAKDKSEWKPYFYSSHVPLGCIRRICECDDNRVFSKNKRQKGHIVATLDTAGRKTLYAALCETFYSNFFPFKPLYVTQKKQNFKNL